MFRLLIPVALAMAGAIAQTQSRVTGTVTDQTGALVVGAMVEARNVTTGVVLSAATNETGTYSFPSLLPGEYELRCQAGGFKSVRRAGVVLETGITRTADFQLELGAVSETVDVKSSTPLLESESSTVGQFIERTTVANMPFQTRRIGSLARLAGAVAYTSENGKLATPQFAMAGGRSENQMWLTDGAVTQNMSLGSPQSVLNPPAESIQEIKMETNNYAAEFGRAGGGLILISTRSGSNAFHGAAYEFFRNDRLDARSFFAPSKAPLRFNVFGGSAGGPVFRNRTFFFVNYEGDRRRTGVTISDSDVPHPQEVNGDFSARRNFTLRDPVGGQPFPGNRIPASRIDPLGQAFAKFYPAPNIASNDIARAPADNYVVNVSDKLTKDFLTIRVDHVAGANDRFFVRFFNANQPNVNAPVFPNAFADSRATDGGSKQRQLLGNWMHNLRPALFNELRYLFDNRLNTNVAPGVGSGVNGRVGLKGVNPNFFATVGVTGLNQLGAGNQRRFQTPIRTQQLQDHVTWIKGKHQIKTGFEYRFSFNQDDANQFAGGQFTFSDRATNAGLASLLLGWTTSAQLIDIDLLQARSDYYGAYIQDNWKLTQTFTLSLGLRWELDTPRWERNNRQSGFDLNATNPVSGTRGIVTFAGRDGRGKYAHDIDKNNIGPRVGLAWRPRQDLVVRAGYGLSHYGAYGDAMAFVLFNGFSLNGSFTSPDGGFTPAFPFRDGMPAVTREPLTAGFGAVPVGSAPRLSPDFAQQNHVNGYSQQWNLTIQKQFRGQTVLETAYLANVGHKLGGQDININQIPLVNGRGPAQQNQRLRPFPQFNNVVHKKPPWGNSSYHAFNAKLEKRYSSGLSFLMNYTWSKFLDDVNAAAEIGGEPGDGYTHLELRRLDKSYSGSDIRHRYIVSSVYELPVGKGRRFGVANPVLDHIAGGWGVGSIFEARTGAPYGVIEQTNTSNTFSGGQRPNILRNPALPGGRSRSDMLNAYFDTAAFVAPAVGEFGNAARNAGFGLGLVQIDLSLHKTFALSERFRLQYRTDFFNLPNLPAFAGPNTNRGRGDFGRISRTATGTSGRELQLSLRLEW